MKHKALLLFSLIIVVVILNSWKLVVKKYEGEQRFKNFPVTVRQIKNDAQQQFKSTSIEPLSIERVFKKDHAWTASISAETITMVATGDVIPARSVNFRTIGYNNFKWPFEKTSDFLKNADLTFINLESPLVKNCPLTNTGMVFCGDQRHMKGLLSAGVDIASLANNHAGNYGIEGVNQTVQLLNKNGIEATGQGSNLIIKEVKGTKFAFLGYNDIEKNQNVVSAEEERIKKEIKDAKIKSDFVVVAFHWGDEYTPQPNNREVTLAHLAVNNGADLIIGNHPHWIQPFEIYKDKFIMYAHGNYVFDQMWSDKTKLGVIGKYIFYKNKLIDVEYFPVKIEDFGQPYFLKGIEKEKILNELQVEALKLSSSGF